MTKDEFEKLYAERSGVTVEWLHAQGRHSIPCGCDYEGCHGWQLVNKEDFPTPESLHKHDFNLEG